MDPGPVTPSSSKQAEPVSSFHKILKLFGISGEEENLKNLFVGAISHDEEIESHRKKVMGIYIDLLGLDESEALRRMNALEEPDDEREELPTRTKFELEHVEVCASLRAFKACAKRLSYKYAPSAAAVSPAASNSSSSSSTPASTAAASAASVSDAKKKRKPKGAHFVRQVHDHPVSILEGTSLSKLEEVKLLIRSAISVGAPAYNRGNIAICYHYYAGCIRGIIETRTDCPGLQGVLRDGMNRAEEYEEDDWDARAWVMRDTFDAVLDVIARRDE